MDKQMEKTQQEKNKRHKQKTRPRSTAIDTSDERENDATESGIQLQEIPRRAHQTTHNSQKRNALLAKTAKSDKNQIAATKKSGCHIRIKSIIPAAYPVMPLAGHTGIHKI